MLVGSRLKNARLSHNLSQEQLGSLLGISKAAVCCYEKETRNPSLETIIEMMSVLGVTSDYLLGADVIVTVENPENYNYKPMTKEEVMFIEELKKDKMVYDILFQEPKKGADLIKKKLG